jgi:hypothetical protein
MSVGVTKDYKLKARNLHASHTVTLIYFGESVIWRQPHDLFRVTETGGGII